MSVRSQSSVTLKPVFRGPLVTLAALLLLFLSLACGGKSTAGGTDPRLPYGNYHPAGWVSIQPGVPGNHGAPAAASLETCLNCHQMSIQVVNPAIPGCLTSGCHHSTRPDWVNTDPGSGGEHGTMAKLAKTNGGGLAGCQICHGNAANPAGGFFAGGVAGKSCFVCHAPSVGSPVAAPHPPKPWRIGAGSTLSHAFTDPTNAPICAQCHFPGSPSNPANHPAAPAPPGTRPDCFNGTLCHGANTAPHPLPFLAGQTDAQLNGHMTVTATAFAADCANCHAHSGPSPVATAPLCSVCHSVADPTLPGTNAGTCLSCHVGTPGLPAGPGGTGFPSIAGVHGKHMTLPTALTCDSCHGGSGTGTTLHYSNANGRIGVPPGPAPVTIDPIFKAKTGGNPAFSGTSLNCSNVSCHGGQTTPGWQNGTIDSKVQCTLCHGIAATAGLTNQHNDAFGRHSLGAHDATVSANGIACTTCHDMGNGSLGALAHFKYLNTQAVDGVSSGTPADQMPSDTIVFDPAFMTGAATYTVNASTQGNGGCALTCHTPAKTHIHTGAPLDTWTSSGSSHPVPFLAGMIDTQANGHLTATAATFTADCSACHAQTGTSPLPGAPLCETCHTLANPTIPATGTGTCLSCHVGASGLPAGPTGTAFPSFAGSHPKHMGLPTALNCNTCHTGSGTTTKTHYDNANARLTPPVGPGSVSIDATFNAQSGGTPGFNTSALTCSSTSCHGGKTSPNWRTGTIAAATQCLVCHSINSGSSGSQYNDALGRHAWGTHSAAGTAGCTICHDMTSGNTKPGAVNHFGELDTHPVSSATKLPSGTIAFKNTAGFPISGAAPYAIDATHLEGDGGCSLTCHTQVHEPVVYHWKAAQGAGMAHPKPFYNTDLSTKGYSHQTTTLTQFNDECINCHDQSGTTAKTGPTCAVCHTLGSPLATGMTAGTCLSCHVGTNFKTQGPTGAAWPSLKGAHPKHLSLSTFTRTSPVLPPSLTASAYPVCQACHVGSVPGDAPQTHYSNANTRLAGHPIAGPASVAINLTFNSQASTAGTTASASAFTCSNTSCHGGQTTPGWQSGTLTVNATTYCNACHVVNAAEYNAPTGRHSSPGEHQQTCDTCHSMTQAKPGAQNHFKYLDTTVVSGVSGTPSDQYPSDTVLFGASVTGSKTYTVTSTTQGNGGCALTCHQETHTTGGNKWNQ